MVNGGQPESHCGFTEVGYFTCPEVKFVLKDYVGLKALHLSASVLWIIRCFAEVLMSWSRRPFMTDGSNLGMINDLIAVQIQLLRRTVKEHTSYSINLHF